MTSGDSRVPADARPPVKLLRVLGPGLLVAATGVGAGDLATATFAGGRLGTTVLWAVVLGAVFKFALTEGLARWQLATDRTLLEGVAARLGLVPIALFLAYFLLWSFFVGSALVAACGVTLHSIVPVFDDAKHGKIVFGAGSSIAAVALVRVGGYALFSRIMGACIAVMFAVVVVTALLLWPGFSDVAAGFSPLRANMTGTSLTWTLALIGGVGGTVTILCYGYWIREEGRSGLGYVRTMRIDLAVGYAMTAIFGLSMVIIGSQVSVDGSGSRLIIALAEALEGQLGPAGRWLFLFGALAAVFSSLLGVWQAVPYLFADMVRLLRREPPDAANTAGRPYRAYLLAIATVPLLGLFLRFKEIQKLYATIGALFVPLLAATLLVLNGRRAWVGDARNRFAATAVLLGTLAFFTWVAYRRWG